jgi:DNA-directed RNA polymerase subunit E'/Rpb7
MNKGNLSKATDVTLERTVAINPKFLNENIVESIKDKIVEKYVGKCDEKNGCIISLKENSVLVLDNYISNAGNGIFFKVRFNVTTIKPKVGKEYEGKVTLIFKDGILLDVMGLIKILIPINKAPGYKFINNQMKKDDKVINKNDIVTVKAEVVKFGKEYTVIGSLKE